RRAGFVAGRGNNLADWYSRQVSQQELFGRWEAKRHSGVVDCDVAKTCLLEKRPQLCRISQRERGGGRCCCLGAHIARRALTLCHEVRRGSSPNAQRDASRGCQDSAHLTKRFQSIREKLQPLLADHDVES